MQTILIKLEQIAVFLVEKQSFGAKRRVKVFLFKPKM